MQLSKNYIMIFSLVLLLWLMLTFAKDPLTALGGIPNCEKDCTQDFTPDELFIQANVYC